MAQPLDELGAVVIEGQPGTESRDSVQAEGALPQMNGRRGPTGSRADDDARGDVGTRLRHGDLGSAQDAEERLEPAWSMPDAGHFAFEKDGGALRRTHEELPPEDLR